MTTRRPAYVPGQVERILRTRDPRPVQGRVTRSLGPIVHALLPGAAIGELLNVRLYDGNTLPAEVIGLDGATAVLAPIGETTGLAAGNTVVRTGRRLQVPVGRALLGRIVDGLGRPLDDGESLARLARRPCESAPIAALRRGPIVNAFPVGIRVIDGLLTCGEGQRIGLYGEPGSGKSVLIGQLIRGASADVVVVALIGERGREVGEFISQHLSGSTRERMVLVVATSDRPALERMRAAHTATTIAEAFREDGLRVLLVMDSVTRFARAMREVGLAAGEPPTRRGFPPSVAAQLPQLLERPGVGARDPVSGITGSITAFYTVLVEGDGSDDPIAEETRSLLDGHIILSPSLASAGQFPAIDVLSSRSRVMDAVVEERHRENANHIRHLLQRYQEIEFLVRVGEYRAGTDPVADEALAKIERIKAFAKQSTNVITTLEETTAWLAQLKG
ncbi:MAG: FliI/YscN family ATPase [Janthinobacterium lividum]